MAPSDEPREPHGADLDAIVREGPWIRRLARGLLGDETAADDLCQDVLVAALDRRTKVEVPRLRAWLRTVALRLAMQKHRRDRQRARVEERAARPEMIEQDAERRLKLHRRLTAAIDALPPTYRTALALRYLDDLPPREIARRLDLSVVAARKRVSRGLALLRERLDAEHGGDRASWSAWVASLLPPGGGASPAPAAAPDATVGPAPEPGRWPAEPGLLTSGKLLALLSAGLLGGLLFLASPFGPVPFGSASGDRAAPQAGEAPLAPKASARPGGAPTAAALATVEKNAQRRPASAAPASADVPRVSVVLPDGRPADGAAAAWVDASGAVHPLELDAEASAPRPEPSAGARFFACAPGRAEAMVRAGDSGDGVEIVLQPWRVLRGRVLEDGGPPGRRLFVLARESLVDRGFSSREYEQESTLEELGALRPSPGCWTRPDGSFALEGLRPGASGRIHLPSTHRFILQGLPGAGGGLPYGADDRSIELETVLLPGVVGRLVWEDGTPVVGTLSVLLEDRNTGSTSGTGARIDPEGRFSIGLPVADRALLEPPRARCEALLHRAVTIDLDLVNGIPAPFRRRVELEGAAFPIDLGVVRVQRARSLAVHVAGSDGESLEGAAVASGLELGKTDADGRARLACAQQDTIEVLAAGYAYAAVGVDGPGASPVEVTLGRGSTLEVLLPPGSPRVRLAWEESPFEGPGGASVVPRSLHGDRLLGRTGPRAGDDRPGSLSFPRSPASELIVPGLRAGSSFRVGLVDVLGQPLDEERVVMPLQPGIHRVDLAGEPGQPCRLRARLADATGVPIPEGSVLIGSRAAGRSTSFGFLDGFLDVGPLAPGTYSLLTQVDDRLPCGIADYELGPDSPLLELELEAARALEVLLVDEEARPLLARSVRARGGEWSQDSRDVWVGRAWLRTPRRPLELTLRVGTRTFRRAIDAEQETVTVTLPAHGRLVVRLAHPPRLRTEDGHVRVRIRESEGEGEAELEAWYTEDARDSLALETDLLPGAYGLEVELIECPGGSIETDEPLVRGLERREVAVEAGAVTLVDVGG